MNIDVRRCTPEALERIERCRQALRAARRKRDKAQAEFDRAFDALGAALEAVQSTDEN